MDLTIRCNDGYIAPVVQQLVVEETVIKTSLVTLRVLSHINSLSNGPAPYVFPMFANISSPHFDVNIRHFPISGGAPDSKMIERTRRFVGIFGGALVGFALVWAGGGCRGGSFLRSSTS